MRERLTHEQRHQRRQEIAEAVRGGASISEMAYAYALTEQCIRKACDEFGVAHGCPTNGGPVEDDRPHGNTLVTPEEWNSADWLLRDVDLAKHFGVSRERVRQKRSELGKPRSPNHHKSDGFVEFRDWVNQNREQISGLSQIDIAAFCPVATNPGSISVWCRKLGIGENVPLKDRITSESLPSLVRKVNFREGLTECWEFLRRRHSYAMIGKQPAHWFIYRLYYGEKPDGMMILHKCDNKKCVNPEHIYAGTAKENAADRARNTPDWFHKISDEQATEMRRLHACGRAITSIADEFKFSYMSVWAVIKGRTHKTSPPRKPFPSEPAAKKRDGNGCTAAIVAMLDAGRSFTSRQFVQETGYRSTDFIGCIRHLDNRGLVSIERKPISEGGNIYRSALPHDRSDSQNLLFAHEATP